MHLFNQAVHTPPNHDKKTNPIICRVSLMINTLINSAILVVANIKSKVSTAPTVPFADIKIFDVILIRNKE